MKALNFCTFVLESKGGDTKNMGEFQPTKKNKNRENIYIYIYIFFFDEQKQRNIYIYIYMIIENKFISIEIW